MLVHLAETRAVPDPILRLGIRRLVRNRLSEEERGGAAAARARKEAFVETLRRSPLALVPDAANRQHYEVPSAFFEAVLGPRRKYSACWFEPDGPDDLAAAEARMLERTCERAGLEDGMTVLDLGCGWGSLSLWIAEHYPACRVLGVSNSKTQRERILRDWQRSGPRDPDRLRVATADVNRFEPGERFDRVISVEMFEHVRNWGVLLERIAGWLAPEGRAFVHHFCHREHAYPYEDAGPGDWMARHFFTGGIMPSEDLLDRFPEHLAVEQRWRVPGGHYRRTSDAWLARLDAARGELEPVLAGCYGAADAALWFRRWRLFFLACSELFGFRDGSEWFVAHARLAPAPRPS